MGRTTERDFLEAAPSVEGASTNLANTLLGQQADMLAEIALYLRRQNADVLCSTVVKGTSQLSNAITDNNCHEVVFEVGGKAVEVFSILIYSTWDGTIAISPASMASIRDGIPLAATDVLNLSNPVYSLYVMTADSVATPLVVNGPAGSPGGLFIYGFTIPDWDRLRGSLRS